MEQTVEILFISSVEHEGEVTKHVQETIGTAYIENEQIVQIEFNDYADDAHHVNTEVAFFFEKQTVIMQRTGESVMEQKYVAGEKHNGLYQTDYGKFQTVAETSKVVIDETHEIFTLELVYDYYASGVKTGEVTIHLEVKRSFVH